MAICRSAQLPAKAAKNFLQNDHFLNELASYTNQDQSVIAADLPFVVMNRLTLVHRQMSSVHLRPFHMNGLERKGRK